MKKKEANGKLRALPIAKTKIPSFWKASLRYLGKMSFTFIYLVRGLKSGDSKTQISYLTKDLLAERKMIL